MWSSAAVTSAWYATAAGAGGPAPRRLVDRIIRDLPQLITHHLDGLDVPEGDAELTAPVRIAIRIPARDLQGPGPLNAHPRHGDLAARLISAPRSPQPTGPQPPRAGNADPSIPLPPRPGHRQPPPAGDADLIALLPPQPTAPPPSPAGKADPPPHRHPSQPTRGRRINTAPTRPGFPAGPDRQPNGCCVTFSGSTTGASSHRSWRSCRPPHCICGTRP